MFALEPALRDNISAVHAIVAADDDRFTAVFARLGLVDPGFRKTIDERKVTVGAAYRSGMIFGFAVGTERHTFLLRSRQRSARDQIFFSTSTNLCVMIRGRVIAEPTTTANAPHLIA